MIFPDKILEYSCRFPKVGAAFLQLPISNFLPFLQLNSIFLPTQFFQPPNSGKKAKNLFFYSNFSQTKNFLSSFAPQKQNLLFPHSLLLLLKIKKLPHFLLSLLKIKKLPLFFCSSKAKLIISSLSSFAPLVRGANRNS